MISVLRNASYAKLFSAQVIALVGTGLLTVALGLLAFDIAGGDAGIVVATALTIKMVAYVAVSPLMIAITARIPRKTLLIAADLTRAAVALSLPFVTEAWQIYILIFLLQSASATFTPTFQAVIPEVLPDEREYTRALSLSRLAYDLESLVSPVLAAALLTVISYNNLFIGTVVGFIGSAILVIATRFPEIRPSQPVPFVSRLTRGARVFLKTAELRSLLAMNLVVATSTAMVIVNTVVLVQGDLGRPQSDVALLLAAYGAGSMIIALLLPRVLDRLPDRRVMLVGAGALPVGLLGALALTAFPVGDATWSLLLVTWLFLGAATSLVMTPSARLLRRASDEENRPAVFAAQFSLSHACFMITYPIAGIVGATWGLWAAAATLAVIGAAAAVAAALAWRQTHRPAVPQRAPEEVER
ncbi:MFS transporter [Microbacterium sp. SA39]|uniref:MFS transporter n=1 Tax=Microbacterium sp. SA39 TaxID=1263625 RepID=UPI0005FA6DE5|nr:MFS transporter [Microbacterium sp. SA39]KJQ53869.1 Major Facilitator Superfamily protein [Microbacterium sp. SA39]